jgi:hypothetical protein
MKDKELEILRIVIESLALPARLGRSPQSGGIGIKN